MHCFSIAQNKVPISVVPRSLTKVTSKSVIIPLNNADFICVQPMIMERGAEC